MDPSHTKNSSVLSLLRNFFLFRNENLLAHTCALEGEAEGEIGIKSDLTFFTRKLHEYYQENKDVSLGYTCKKHYVDNPDEVGYDIILDDITEVNHLAITRAGRGGSQVSGWNLGA